MQFLLASELFFLPNKGIGLHSTSAVNSKLCCHSPSVNYEQCYISKEMDLFFKAGQHFPLKIPLIITHLEITQPLQKCILFTTQELHGEENYRPCWVTKSTTRAESVAQDSIIILIDYLWHSENTKHQCEHLVISQKVSLDLDCTWGQVELSSACTAILVVPLLTTYNRFQNIYPLIIRMNCNTNNTPTREAAKVRVLELCKRQE